MVEVFAAGMIVGAVAYFLLERLADLIPTKR